MSKRERIAGLRRYAPGVAALGDGMSRRVDVNGATFEIHAPAATQVAVIRALTGSTQTDDMIDALPAPAGPSPAACAVRALRWYRARISSKTPGRCAYEPTCSRYAELAIRIHGVRKGLILGLRRVVRCRGQGGLDLPL